MRLLLLPFFLFATFASSSQDTLHIYLDSSAKTVVDKNHAEYVFNVYKTGDRWRLEKISLPDYLFETLSYKDSTLTILDGLYRSYSSKNIIQETGEYRNGKKENIWLGFSKKGVLTDSIVFRQGDQLLAFKLDFRHNIISAAGTSNNELEKIFFKQNGIQHSGFISGRGTYFETVYNEQGRIISNVKLEGDKLVRVHSKAVQPDPKPHFPGGRIGFDDFFERELFAPSRKLFPALFPARFSAEVLLDKNGIVSEIKIVQSVRNDFDNFVISILKSMPPWLMFENRKHKQEIELFFQ